MNDTVFHRNAFLTRVEKTSKHVSGNFAYIPLISGRNPAVGGGASASGNTNPPGQNDGGPGGSGSYLSDGFVGPTAPSYGTTSPTSSARHFAGGGGGGNANTGNSAGGDGGGGRSNPSGGGQAGTTNTGGGGGGAYAPSPSSGSAGASGAGGSGIVMIRYKFQN